MSRIKTWGRSGLILMIIISTRFAMTQEHYLPGYIIKNKMDTIHGYVDYRDWAGNPDRISFKQNAEESPSVFSPSEISCFVIPGDIFICGIVNTMIAPSSTNEPDTDSLIKTRIDTVFLQAVFIGNKSLYYYRSSNGTDHFYIQTGTGFELLLYKRYMEENDSSLTIRENSIFHGQLALYLNDCEHIQQHLDGIDYNQKSMTKLFERYYKCTGAEVTFQKICTTLKTEFGIIGGISVTTLRFSGNGSDYLWKTEYQPSANFSAGLFLDLIFTGSKGRWSLYNELFLSTYRVSGKNEVRYKEDYYSVISTELGYSYLKMNNLVQYKHPIGPLSFIIHLGISNGFCIQERNEKITESLFYETFSVVREPVLAKTRKTEQGLIFGSGLKFKRFLFELRIEVGNGMSSYSNVKSETTRYYGLLGYQF